MSLYNELKRRNVFRVAIAYLAGAWLLTEVAGTLFPAFGIPDWGARFVVTAQLVDVRTDSHLWSQTYDRELEDIFAIQDEISGQIVKALKIALGVGEQEAMARVRKCITCVPLPASRMSASRRVIA